MEQLEQLERRYGLLIHRGNLAMSYYKRKCELQAKEYALNKDRATWYKVANDRNTTNAVREWARRKVIQIEAELALVRKRLAEE